MQQENKEYAETLPLLTESRFSIDRLTMLVYSPGFSMYESDTEKFEDMRGYQLRDSIKKLITYFDDMVLKFYDGTEKSRKVLYSMETKLYAYHYRIKDIDIQFCTKLPKSKRLNDSDFVEIWGNEEDKARGYMYEFYNNAYNIRIEYNPNKADISLLAEILNTLRTGFYKDSYSSEFIRITRVDFAFDYPEAVNPALVNFRKSRKYANIGGTQGLETDKRGAQKSTFNLCVYDKKKEYSEKFNIFYPGKCLWRIELRCHHTWFIHELPGIGHNVLPRIEIFNAGQQTGDYMMDFILMIGLHWGIRTPLGMLPHTTRERYLKAYRTLNLPTIKHPSDLYHESFRTVWDLERDKILSSFGFEPEKFCSRALSDSQL